MFFVIKIKNLHFSFGEKNQLADLNLPNFLSIPQIAKEEREKGKRLLALGWVMNGKEARQKEAGQH